MRCGDSTGRRRRRGEVADAGAKAHHGRKHPFSRFGLAPRIGFGSCCRATLRRGKQRDDQHRLRHRLGDDYRLGRLRDGLHRRAAMLVGGGILAARIVLMLRFAIMMVRSRAVLVSFGIVVKMLGIVRVPVVLPGNRVMVGSRIRLLCRGVVVSIADGYTLPATQRQTDRPHHHARPCERTEREADSRLS